MIPSESQLFTERSKGDPTRKARCAARRRPSRRSSNSRCRHSLKQPERSETRCGAPGYRNPRGTMKGHDRLSRDKRSHRGSSGGALCHRTASEHEGHHVRSPLGDEGLREEAGGSRLPGVRSLQRSRTEGVGEHGMDNDGRKSPPRTGQGGGRGSECASWPCWCGDVRTGCIHGCRGGQ